LKLFYPTVDSASEECSIETGLTEDWQGSDEAVLPLKLIRLLERKDFWRKRSLVGTNERTAQILYARVHQDPVLYRNLYHYIVYRYQTHFSELILYNLCSEEITDDKVNKA
jgi:hypothetical protein